MSGRGNHQDVWRPIRTIGEGAQGTSILVERTRDGRLAVCKRTRDYTDRQISENSTPLEATILQEILPSDRRLVELFHFSFEPRHHLYDLIEWFEYCRGGDLEHAVTGAVPEDFIWHCFIQIAEALDVVHNAGSHRVVHRDIKPDNIFLESKYHPQAPWPNLKLGDFGMAVLEAHTEYFLAPCWQGPELPHCCTAGDVWGLGAIVHWLAHGKPPICPRRNMFPGSKEDWEAQPEARWPSKLPLSYSDALNEHMMACFEWDPKDRISSPRLVALLKRDRPRTWR